MQGETPQPDTRLGYIEGSTIYTTDLPEPGEWECQILGGPHGVVWRPAKGQEPNAFHRFMQRLCFGFVWRKRWTTGY